MSIRILALFALSLALLPSIGSAQGFGRVFSTPAEREYLDSERDRYLQTITMQDQTLPLDTPIVVDEIVESEPLIIHMGGSIRRNDGNHTVWLNGVSVRQSELPANARLEFVNGLGILHVRGLEREYIVKPGQTLNADTGDIREDFELTEQELEEVNAQVLAREESNRRTRVSPVKQSEDEQVESQSEGGGMVQAIVDGLRVLAESRAAQGSIESELQ